MLSSSCSKGESNGKEREDFKERGVYSIKGTSKSGLANEDRDQEDIRFGLNTATQLEEMRHILARMTQGFGKR